MTAYANGSAEPVQDFRPGLTIGQAASRLGVSPSTVRRWVRSGQLRSDRVTVGDGFEYRIPAEGLEAVRASANPSAGPVANGSTNAAAPAILEASVERSTALAAYNAHLLGPLTAVIERQQDTIRQQAEQVGSLRARLATAEERIRALEATRPQERPAEAPDAASPAEEAPGVTGAPPNSWWRRLWRGLAVP